MESQNKHSIIKPPAILILADFSDGSWHAASFAMQFLHTSKLPVYIMQTFQNPNFGQSMLRDIVPRLKEITKYELKALKKRLLKSFENVKAKHIKLLSMNGDLVNLLQNNLDLKYSYNIVIGSYSSFADSCTMQNLCMAKIISCSDYPLFVVPQLFKQKKNSEILFVANRIKVPSPQVVIHILNICKKTNSKLDILFVVDDESQKMSLELKEFFKHYFKGIIYNVFYTKNSSVCKGMKNYIKNNYKDLIIIESNRVEYIDGYSKTKRTVGK